MRRNDNYRRLIRNMRKMLAAGTLKQCKVCKHAWLAKVPQAACIHHTAK